jgi:hypothetical protein
MESSALKSCSSVKSHCTAHAGLKKSCSGLRPDICRAIHNLTKHVGFLNYTSRSACLLRNRGYSKVLCKSEPEQALRTVNQSLEQLEVHHSTVILEKRDRVGKRLSLGFSASVLAFALSSGAWAGDSSEGEAFIGSSYDPVVTVVFGIIVLCLVIVTGGVRPACGILCVRAGMPFPNAKSFLPGNIPIASKLFG